MTGSLDGRQKMVPAETMEKVAGYSTGVGERKNTSESINNSTYSRAARHRLYVKEYWLPAEASVLLDFGSDIISRKILEVGAGSGRLCSVLKYRAAEYCATDANSDMIATLLANHSEVNAFVADARNLANIASASFDTVIFSFNGIDSLPFSDRVTALSAINRVLRVKGAFIHSTHNLEHARAASYRIHFIELLRAPWSFIRRACNRSRIAHLESYTSDHAVINDRALQNGLLNVYIDPRVHFSHLKSAGFGIEALYDREGRRIDPSVYPNDQWYYIVARKCDTQP